MPPKQTPPDPTMPGQYLPPGNRLIRPPDPPPPKLNFDNTRPSDLIVPYNPPKLNPYLNQLQDLSSTENLEASIQGELVKDKRVTLRGDVTFHFTNNENKYFLFVNPESNKLLVANPSVVCPAGLQARIVVLQVSEVEIKTTKFDLLDKDFARKTYTSKGYKVSCEVEITATRDVFPGDHTITITLPDVMTFRKIWETTSPSSPPKFNFQVKVYESELARLQAKAAEEKARQERLAAEEKARQERLAVEEKARQERQAAWAAQNKILEEQRAAEYKILEEQRAAREWDRNQREEARRSRIAVNLAIWSAVSLGVVALFVTFVVASARIRWLKLRPRLFVRPEALDALASPGLIATNLSPANWLEAFRSTLDKATRALGSVDSKAAQEAAAALASAKAAPPLAVISREVAIRALQNGSVQSVLTRVEGRMVYLVAFPGRHEHSELYRRYEPFVDGWEEHVTQLRNQLAASAPAPGLLCLLYFLSPHGRDGTLLVAFEGETGRVLPGELVPRSDTGDERAFRLMDRYDFRLG